MCNNTKPKVAAIVSNYILSVGCYLIILLIKCELMTINNINIPSNFMETLVCHSKLYYNQMDNIRKQDADCKKIHIEFTEELHNLTKYLKSK